MDGIRNRVEYEMTDVTVKWSCIMLHLSLKNSLLCMLGVKLHWVWSLWIPCGSPSLSCDKVPATIFSTNALLPRKLFRRCWCLSFFYKLMMAFLVNLNIQPPTYTTYERMSSAQELEDGDPWTDLNVQYVCDKLHCSGWVTFTSYQINAASNCDDHYQLLFNITAQLQ